MSKVSRQIDGKLMHLMMNEFSLMDHFLALKKFILLGQGDFVTCLMDEVGPELKKRATQLYRHNLSGARMYLYVCIHTHMHILCIHTYIHTHDHLLTLVFIIMIA